MIMFRSLIRNQTQLLFTIKKQSILSAHNDLRFIHRPIFNGPGSSAMIRIIAPQPYDPPDFTDSYLINLCGLSSKRIQIRTVENPDILFGFLKSNGFNDTQIANLVAKFPLLLLARFEMIIKPNLDYLKSVGFNGPSLVTLVSADPQILIESLEKRLKPNYELLISIIGNTQQIASAVRRTSRLLQDNLETDFLPNIRMLQSCGIPESSIAKLATQHPRVVMMPVEQFKERVLLIQEMGFNPLSTMFVHRVAAVARINRKTWDKKMAFYKNLGWSSSEIISAFSRQPLFIALSEEIIRKKMDFYVKKLQWGPSFLSAHPVLLTLSLEKRVLPRFSVLSVLESKGYSVFNSTATFLRISEKDFLSKYVFRYNSRVPKLLEVYKVHLESAGAEG